MKPKFLITIFLLLITLSCKNENVEPYTFLQYDWETSNPADLNIDQDLLDDAFAEAEKLDYIYSILLIRNGKIAVEKYFNGQNKDSEINIRSVSKSFLSAAVGISVNKGILSKNDKLTEILNNYDSQIVDNRFSQITIEHLLKMRSGLDSDNNIYNDVVYSTNLVSTIFSLTLINDPGEKFVYSTPATHLLSAVLTKASEISSFDFVTENLLVPMGIELNYWEQDPQGIYYGGNNMFFTTRNMAVLGLLYLNKGVLNNQQVVPNLWIEESLIDHIGGTSTWGPMSSIGYGYLWWLGKIKDYNIFTAIGHGGQFVLCVPELDLIVATNAHSNIGWDEANLQELEILNIISNYIIPAVIPIN